MEWKTKLHSLQVVIAEFRERNPQSGSPEASFLFSCHYQVLPRFCQFGNFKAGSLFKTIHRPIRIMFSAEHCLNVTFKRSHNYVPCTISWELIYSGYILEKYQFSGSRSSTLLKLSVGLDGYWCLCWRLFEGNRHCRVPGVSRQVRTWVVHLFALRVHFSVKEQRKPKPSFHDNHLLRPSYIPMEFMGGGTK